MTLKELIEKMKLRGKKTAAVVGMSAALGATAVGCGEKEEVVEPAIKTETVDETVVVEEEIKVEEAPVEEAPVVEAPIVEELEIATITLEQVETRISEIMQSYPEINENYIRNLIAVVNKPYLENENDYLNIMGVQSIDELEKNELGRSVTYIPGSILAYDLHFRQDMIQSEIFGDKPYLYYQDLPKYEQIILPAELSEVAKFIDVNTNVLCMEEKDSEGFTVAANNIAYLYMGISNEFDASIQLTLQSNPLFLNQLANIISYSKCSSMVDENIIDAVDEKFRIDRKTEMVEEALQTSKTR